SARAPESWRRVAGTGPRPTAHLGDFRGAQAQKIACPLHQPLLWRVDGAVAEGGLPHALDQGKPLGPAEPSADAISVVREPALQVGGGWRLAPRRVAPAQRDTAVR